MGVTLAAVPVGLAVGSAAGAALTRWPAGLTLGRPARSRCDACGDPIAPSALVPVVGWLVRRGRCATCGMRIHPGQPALEVAGAVALAAAVAVPPLGTGIVLGGVGVVVALAAALDLGHRWVPDRLTLPTAAVVVPASLALAVASSAGARTVLLHGLGVPGLLAVLHRVTARRATGPWVGGGDVKLLVPVLAAAALVPAGPVVIWAGALASGGVVAAVGMASGRTPRGTRLPFVPFLAIGWGALLMHRVAGGAV
jgi:leader peptidase (prepilin peptidase)/N-methyltransferase